MSIYRRAYDALTTPASADEDTGRREYILNVILIASIGVLLLLDALVAYHTIVRNSPYSGIPFWIFSLFPAFLILLYALSKRGHAASASYLLTGALLLGNTYAVLRWGVDLPVTLLVYAFVICMASILRGSGFGFATTLCTALLLASVWHMHVNGIVIPEQQYPTEDDIIILSTFYFLIMVVSWLSNREIKKTLDRARSSEGELMHERDLLEIRIEERTNEIRRIQFEEVERIHRFAEFGQLSSGLFHDILNLLNAISLRTEGKAEDEPSLAAAYATTRQIRQFMKSVQEQLGRGNSREIFSLGESISQAIRLVSYKAAKENVRIVHDEEISAPLLYEGVPFKFHQIIINLLTNAIDSYRGIPLSAGHSRTVSVSAHQEGDSALIAVKDEGCGIPADHIKKLFDPFFTTKERSEGIGIGLATVKKTVEEDLRGTIVVQSAPNVGSVFMITFPLHPFNHVLSADLTLLPESPLDVSDRIESDRT